jgi:phage tail-like protein
MPDLPLLNFRYRVEIAGLVVAGFSEVTGLNQEIEVEELIEGGMDFVHHLPKGIKHSNLVLKRGLSTSSELRKWYKDVLKAISYRKPIPKCPDIYISIIGPTGEDEIRFHIKSAYPIKWSGPELKAMGSEVASETLELVHEGLEIV